MSRAGFTLVELILVLAISIILFSVIGSLAVNTYPKSQIRSNAAAVTQTIRLAQTYTLSRKYDSAWGVYRTSTDLTLFAGTSYATRNTAHDQIHVFPAGITASGLVEVVFHPLDGTTTDVGTITLTSDATGESVVLTVNENGVVSF